MVQKGFSVEDPLNNRQINTSSRIFDEDFIINSGHLLCKSIGKNMRLIAERIEIKGFEVVEIGVTIIRMSGDKKIIS